MLSVFGGYLFLRVVIFLKFNCCCCCCVVVVVVLALVVFVELFRFAPFCCCFLFCFCFVFCLGGGST